MRFIKLSICSIFLSILAYSVYGQDEETKIIWDSWGVPHIYANSVEELFYAQGWAQMHNHANLILELYGVSRGKAAEYWGEEYLQGDILIATLGFEELAKKWIKRQDKMTSTMTSEFVRGLNDYALAHPEAIDEKFKVVLPLTVEDFNMHSMFVIFTRFVGGNDLGRAQRWPSMGSNAYAVGPKRSASGNAMLVQNPHLPWFGEFTFFENHFILNGKNMYGATLVGFPGIAIGFNDHLGWSHTNNTLDNTDTYELELTEDGYVLDGKSEKFKTETKQLKVKLQEGALQLKDVEIYHSEFGPIIKKHENKALAIRMAGLDSQDMFLQWWKMINSTSLEEFEQALQMAKIPFWNVMYADKKGNIMYVYNGLLPKRKEGSWQYWNGIVEGSKSENIWTEVHPYDDLPKLKNPETGWLQNANDPPWTATIPVQFNPADFVEYMAPLNMTFRPQISAKQLFNDESITYDELVDYKHSTHIELADRILDDLFKAIDTHGEELAKEAKNVLEGWDRKADAESTGMLLFNSWARKWNVWLPQNYTIPWTLDDPLITPDGISDPQKAVKLLEETAAEIKAVHGKLDVKWGEYYKIKHGDKMYPANGSDGSLGIFRVAWPAMAKPERAIVGGGDSWVGVIEFDEDIRAQVLLSYGNASQDNSPHKGDQLELFSKKELRNVWLMKEEILQNAKKVERLKNGRFILASE